MSAPTLQLPATNEQINALVAEHVAGWTAIVDPHGCRKLLPPGSPVRKWRYGISAPDYLTDANAVLFLVDGKSVWVARRWPKLTPKFAAHLMQPRMNGLLRFEVWRAGESYIGEADTFCRAACLALLRAAGVKVKEAKP